MNCSRHENWHQSDIFSNPRMSRCLIFRHFPALLLPATTVYILMCEDVEIHQNLPTHLILLFDRYIWDIKVNPRHHLVCRVHLVNPMCTGIDVLCQGDWCSLPPEPAAAPACCPKVFFFLTIAAFVKNHLWMDVAPWCYTCMQAMTSSAFSKPSRVG